jgi:glycerate kinase
VAFADATLEKGVELVAAAVGLAQRLECADLCLTGEGRLDASSSFGKTATGVAGAAKGAGVPVVCICGQAAPDAPREAFSGVFPLVADEVTEREALTSPSPLLKRLAAQAVRRFGRV